MTMSPRTALLPTVAALLLTAGTAAAQVTGGIAFPPGPIPGAAIPGAAMAQAFSQAPRLPVSVNPQNIRYLKTKRDRMGHLIEGLG